MSVDDNAYVLSDPIEIAMCEEDYGVVKDAAFMEDKTVEDFITDAALERAGEVLMVKAALKEQPTHKPS